MLRSSKPAATRHETRGKLQMLPGVETPEQLEQGHGSGNGNEHRARRRAGHVADGHFGLAEYNTTEISHGFQ